MVKNNANARRGRHAWPFMSAPHMELTELEDFPVVGTPAPTFDYCGEHRRSRARSRLCFMRLKHFLTRS